MGDIFILIFKRITIFNSILITSVPLKLGQIKN